jgi:hypothetical protein
VASGAISSSETSVNFQCTTLRYILEDSTLQVNNEFALIDLISFGEKRVQIFTYTEFDGRIIVLIQVTSQ